MKQYQTEKGCWSVAVGLLGPDSALTTAVGFACFGQQHFAGKMSDRPTENQH